MTKKKAPAKPEKLSHVQELLARSTALKNSIAKQRDELRDIVDELSDIQNSLETGITDLENGLDEISKYL